MTHKMSVTRIVAAVVGLAGLALPGHVLAQGKSRPPTSNLGIVQSGDPRGYAFLLPPKGQTEVFIDVRPDSTVPPADEWTWHVDNSDAQIKSALVMKWYAQASCPDNLTLLQVSARPAR